MNASSTPKHLWIVGVLGLLWSAMGALDYLMTQTQNEAYMGNFSPEQLEFFYGLPTWTVATWAFAVWGGVLGCILLLFRSRWAVGAFVVSLIGMAFTFVQNFILSNGIEVMGGAGEMIFTGVIIVVSILLWIYARRMVAKGVLR